MGKKVIVRTEKVWGLGPSEGDRKREEVRWGRFREVETV